MMLYFAYGSNLSKEQMKRRCPTAEPLGRYTLRNAKLVFRGVADVTHEEGAVVHGGLYEISDEDEELLDRFEGYDPDFPGMGRYTKRHITMEDGQKLMFYTMNSSGIYPPTAHYLAIIRRGYADFGLPTGPLDAAVRHAHDAKRPTYIERQWLRRNGRPELASRPQEKRHDKGKGKHKAKAPKAKLHDPYATMPVERQRRKVMNLSDWLKDRKYHGLPH